MGKLHELLAVEGDLKAQAQRKAHRVKDLFQDGTGKFLGQISTHQPASENDEQLPAKVTNVATTVNEQLRELSNVFARWIDASIQKEATNQNAKALLRLDSEDIELPATGLLNLENKLLELRAVYRTIPTNDITTPWKYDEDNEYFVSDPPEIRRTTKKVMGAFVAYEATDKHPAQVQTFSEDVLSGHHTITKQSGMITPREKRERLDRLETLLLDVKRARQRANDIEVETLEIGDQIFAHINGE
jgi:hypothetical protein